MPDDEPTPKRDDSDGGVFTGYGIGSVVLGVIAVAAVALATLIWTQHRGDDDELRYRARAMQAAADWTSVLVNMNKDTVEADMNTLHEGTVGQLNADFDSSVEPYRQLVQKLQARTTGQIDSVAVESLHNEQPGPGGAEAPKPQPELSESASRTDTVMVVATSVSETAGTRETADRALDSAARRLRCRRQAADLAAGAGPMRNRWRVLAFDIVAPIAAIAGLVYVGMALAWPLWWVSVCSVLCLLVIEGVAVNIVLARRDGVTVGTDDDGPLLRLGVAALAAAALVAGVVVGYLNWTVPDRTLRDDTAEVVGIASSVVGGVGDLHAAEPHRIHRPGHRDDVTAERRDVQERIHQRGKGFDEPEHLGTGQYGVGGYRSDRADGCQRRGDHARHAAGPWPAARQRGACAPDHPVQTGRALAGRRRVADPLALAEQPRVVDLQTAVHHHL